MKSGLGRAYRFLILVLLVVSGVALERIGTIEYLSDPFELEYTLHLVAQHLYMVGVSMAMAASVGLLVGIVFTRPGFKRYSGIMLYIVGLGQTVPSLAVIALAMSFLGIGYKTAIFALLDPRFYGSGRCPSMRTAIRPSFAGSR